MLKLVKQTIKRVMYGMSAQLTTKMGYGSHPVSTFEHIRILASSRMDVSVRKQLPLGGYCTEAF